MFHTITLFALICLQNVYANTDIYYTCQTPFYQQGLCKPFSECPALFNLLQNRTKTVESFLRMSYCGGVPRMPRVCCPDVVLDIDNLKDDGSTQNILLPSRDICGIAINNKLIGGSITFITDFPYTALLKYEKKDLSQEFYCGGTLINERYILTAAHCIRGRRLPKNAKLVSVRLGEHTIETNPDCDNFGGTLDCADPVVDLEVEEAVVHENYNPDDGNQYHDIALVRLKTKVNFTDFVTPICLPEGKNENYTNKILEWPGWGTFGDHAPNSTKFNGIVNVDDSDGCSKTLHLNLTENQFCGFIHQSYKYCSGDSGGALFEIDAGKNHYNHYVAGILSIGSCDRNKPLVFTKVDKYRRWIISKLKP